MSVCSVESLRKDFALFPFGPLRPDLLSPMSNVSSRGLEADLFAKNLLSILKLHENWFPLPGSTTDDNDLF